MNTVLYFEWNRKKETMLGKLLWPLVLSFILFFVCIVVDRMFPVVNATYMKWPDILKDLLCLNSWMRHLWFNVWQFFALAYPFYLVYVLMQEAAEAVTEEERLETTVYLYNAGVGKGTILAAKLLIWAGEAAACCVSLMASQAVFALALHSPHVAMNVVKYYGQLLLVCVLYLAIAAFMAVCSGKISVASDKLMALLLLPALVSRIPAILRFFARIMEMTGREGDVADKLSELGVRLDALRMVSPVTWSWPVQNVNVAGVVCGVVVFVVMLVSAFSIYTHKAAA